MVNIEDAATYLAKGRIVDLSRRVTPGEAEGPPGAPKRRYQLTAFSYPPGEIMHYIDMESHISTHVEAPSHYVPVRHGRNAHDVSEVALSRFFGMATLVDCKEFPPQTPIGADVLARFDIQENDIVLIGNCPHKGDNRSFMVKEGVEHLVTRKIKMIGFDDTVCPEDPLLLPKDLKTYFTHDLMLSNEIPIIEMLANLGELKKQRFLFFGFPAKMGGLDSFPIRAVAIEGE
ncbi:cyclase family protein [Chloroflexota bacterium]